MRRELEVDVGMEDWFFVNTGLKLDRLNLSPSDATRPFLSPPPEPCLFLYVRALLLVAFIYSELVGMHLGASSQS